LDNEQNSPAATYYSRCGCDHPESHSGRLTVESLTSISDEPKHGLPVRILAEIALTLKLIAENANSTKRSV
jgi:hypothetical protein